MSAVAFDIMNADTSSDEEVPGTPIPKKCDSAASANSSESKGINRAININKTSISAAALDTMNTDTSSDEDVPATPIRNKCDSAASDNSRAMEEDDDSLGDSSSDDTAELIAKTSAKEKTKDSKLKRKARAKSTRPLSRKRKAESEDEDDEEQRRTDYVLGVCPDNRRCTYPGCTKYRRHNRMCMYHNTNLLKKATGKSTMPRSRKRKAERDDEHQAKNSKPSEGNEQSRTDDDADADPVARGVPEWRICTYPGCTKFRRENGMCIYHNTRQEALTVNGDDTDNISRSESNGTETDTSRISKTKRRACGVPECTKLSRGSETNYMCINHFQLWSSAATNGAPKRRRCIYPGCTRYRFKNHMCRFHNARHATSKRNEDDTDNASKSESNDTDTSRIFKTKERRCRVPECTRLSRGSRTNYMCINHFNLDTDNISISESKDPEISRASKTQICRVPECTQLNRGRETNYMCQNHFELNGNGKERNTIICKRICEVPGCNQCYFGSYTNHICPFHRENLEYKKMDGIIKCTIKGCKNIIKTKEGHTVCKNHVRTFGMNPPTEMKRCQHSLMKNRSHKKLYCKYGLLYKHYNMASINHDWQSSYSVEKNCEVTADQNFPLEKQKEFALVRKQVVRIAKKEQSEFIMAKRFTRGETSEHQSIENSTIKRLLNGERVLSKELAVQILQNIKKKGAHNIGNYRDTIVAEATVLLKSNGDRGREENHHTLKSNINHGGEESQHAIYKHMPINIIDEFVGWSTSQRGNIISKNDASNRTDYFHRPTIPQMPSTMAFLRQMLEKKLSNRIKQNNSSREDNSKRTERLLAQFDWSAFQAISIIIEEALTSSLMPLAREYVTHNYTTRKEELIVPISAAVAELCRDKSTNIIVSNLLSNNRFKEQKGTEDETAKEKEVAVQNGADGSGSSSESDSSDKEVDSMKNSVAKADDKKAESSDSSSFSRFSE